MQNGRAFRIGGRIESGVDIERRIVHVFQTCRNASDIKAAFDRIQTELDDQIQVRMAETRETLLENFDADVSERLRIHRDRTLESLSTRELIQRIERQLRQRHSIQPLFLLRWRL